MMDSLGRQFEQAMPFQRLRMLGSTCLGALFIMTAASGCSGPPPAKPTAPVAGANATLVSVAPAVSGSIDRTVEVTGKLAALQDVVLGANLAGRVGSVGPHAGDPVSAGQIVAEMDQADYISQIRGAEANLQGAIIREQQARTAHLQAINQLSNANTTQKWTVKTTSVAVDTANAALRSAEERLSVVKQGARAQERKQAEDQVRVAKANYEKAKNDLKRFQSLYREQVVSQAQLDQAEATSEAAAGTYSSVQAALSLIREGARPEDIRVAELAVQQAKEAVTRAEADRDQVRLREQDVQIAKMGVESAQSGVKAARSAVDLARATLKVAQEALTKSSVRSPISGFVAERKAEPGQQLGSGGAILRVVDPSTVYFEAIVSESQYSLISPGLKVDVTVDAFGGKTISGRISRIFPVASSASRSFSVRIDLQGDRELRPEMFARGRIKIDTHKDATLVPKDAVIFDATSGKTTLYVANSNNKAELRELEIGYSDPKQVEVRRGVAVGDKVVVAGQTTLQNGDNIRTR